MGRDARLSYPGLVYHVVNRGNDRQVIFAEPEDYRHYLNTNKWCRFSQHNVFQNVVIKIPLFACVLECEKIQDDPVGAFDCESTCRQQLE